MIRIFARYLNIGAVLLSCVSTKAADECLGELQLAVVRIERNDGEEAVFKGNPKDYEHIINTRYSHPQTKKELHFDDLNKKIESLNKLIPMEILLNTKLKLDATSDFNLRRDTSQVHCAVQWSNNNSTSHSMSADVSMDVTFKKSGHQCGSKAKQIQIQPDVVYCLGNINLIQPEVDKKAGISRLISFFS